MNDLLLEGCISSVLASYLKALAVHRLVTEQADPSARSWWDNDGRFHLVSKLTWEEIVAFLAHSYRPTPIVTPWNGGSGWWGRSIEGLSAIRTSTDARFESYRQTVVAVDGVLAALNITDKPKNELKQQLLERLRTRLSDDALQWLDVVYVVSEEPRFAAILGSGGNDGNMDFASNFMARLGEMFCAPAKKRSAQVTCADRAYASLFGKARADIRLKVAAGQFSPARVGGANMGEGLDGDSGINPWDYVLAIEGALTFAGTAMRRLESDGDRAAAFPFHVAMSPIGYSSAATSDGDTSKGRSELWLPLWSEPASYREVVALFSEGRLQVGAGRAHNGLEAARAVASLGVDRGVNRFQRIGLLARNGLAFLATSQGVFDVHAVPHDLLLESVYDFVRRVEYVKEPAAGVAAAIRALQTAMFDASRHEAHTAVGFRMDQRCRR
jgi:CRISPR-associated protein Csx17